MKKNIQCSCAATKKLSCSNCSTIKMVLLLKNQYKHLKLEKNDGSLVNPIWYNYLSKNRKPPRTIIDTMYQRYQNSIYLGKTNCLMFFDNDTKELIHKIKTT